MTRRRLKTQQTMFTEVRTASIPGALTHEVEINTTCLLSPCDFYTS